MGSPSESAPEASISAVKVCRTGVTATGFSRNVAETVKQRRGSETLVGMKASDVRSDSIPVSR